MDRRLRWKGCLFRAKDDLLQYGAEHYRIRSADTSTLLLDLFERYQLEGKHMGDALQEFYREKIDALLKKLPVEERLKGLPVEERLKGVSAAELLAALSPEQREALARELKGNGSAPDPK
jgi:hypothetical protein